MVGLLGRRAVRGATPPASYSRLRVRHCQFWG